MNGKMSYSILACPICKTRLDFDAKDQALSCAKCQKKYILDKGVPIFVDTAFVDENLGTESGERMKQEYNNAAGLKSLYKKCRGYLENKFYHIIDLSGMIETAVSWNGPGTITIDVGGGPNRLHEKMITLNMDKFPNVDIVADANQLPFPDSSVDSVFCSAVLEHLPDPAIAVKEAYRVLKPGGYYFAGVPFLQAFHGYPADYTRWTIDGLRKLCEEFREVNAGVSNGPSSAIVDILSAYVALFSNNKYLKAILSRSVRFILLPLRYVDLLLLRSKDANIVASGVYYFGRKPERN